MSKLKKIKLEEFNKKYSIRLPEKNNKNGKLAIKDGRLTVSGLPKKLDSCYEVYSHDKKRVVFRSTADREHIFISLLTSTLFEIVDDNLHRVKPSPFYKRWERQKNDLSKHLIKTQSLLEEYKENLPESIETKQDIYDELENYLFFADELKEIILTAMDENQAQEDLL